MREMVLESCRVATWAFAARRWGLYRLALFDALEALDMVRDAPRSLEQFITEHGKWAA